MAELKGKTVLLDFWTTWCPPCQADAPSIDKLNQQYGDKNLAIVGISMNEDREIVEKYLKKHPHSYPVVLSSENQMPRPYQISAFPTYLIIGPDGMLMTAEEGNKGFGKLQKTSKRLGWKWNRMSVPTRKSEDSLRCLRGSERFFENHPSSRRKTPACPGPMVPHRPAY